MNEKQITINFEHSPLLTREDFMVSKANVEAISMIDLWPNWNSFALCIYGPASSGKTHLANIFANKIYSLEKFTNKIPFVEAKDITIENIYSFFETHRCLIVENLSEESDNEAIFHLYNLYKNENGFILFTSPKAPARMVFPLKDLSSRLNSIPAIEIHEPDDDLLSALIIKLYNDRQINVSPDVIKYIINNSSRSFSYIKKLVTESDLISLSRKRAISVSIIKEAISTLNSDKQIKLI